MQRKTAQNYISSKLIITNSKHLQVTAIWPKLLQLHVIHDFKTTSLLITHKFRRNQQWIYLILILEIWYSIPTIHGLHCVKNVQIQNFSGPHFPVFGLNTRNTDQKKLHICTLTTQCWKKHCLIQFKVRITYMDCFHRDFRLPWRDEGAYLTKRFGPVRQQGELVGATQLGWTRTNRSSLC